MARRIGGPVENPPAQAAPNPAAAASPASAAPVVAPPSRLQSLLSFTDSAEYHQLLMLYGEPATGKTHLFGTAHAAGKRVLLLDCDMGGSETLWRLPVPVIKIPSSAVFETVCRDLRAGAHRDFDVLGIDTLSQLQETKRFELEQQGVGKNDWQRYDMVKDWLHFELLELRKLPLFIVLTTHEKRTYTQAVNASERVLEWVGPLLAPAVWQRINPITTFAGRLTYRADASGKGQERMLDFRARPVFTTKDRLGVLPPVVVPPDMAVIFAALQAAEGKNRA